MGATKIHIVNIMVNIVFQDKPSKARNARNWRVHTGHHLNPFREFATKREAAEFSAHLGRECTVALRDLNDIYRRTTEQGQGYCPAMTGAQIVAWNQRKQSFDNSLAFLAIRLNIIVPNAMNRLLIMARDCKAMASMISAMSKVKYTGCETAMRSCWRDATAVEDSLIGLWSGFEPEAIERRMQA